MTPPFLLRGSYISYICTLLYWMFSEVRSNSSIGAFLAFIILGSDAILGTLSLKSQVMTAGELILTISSPVSTSRVT